MIRSEALELRFTSEMTQLKGVREAVRAWAEAGGWTADRVADIVLAVDEALTNVIRHGYQGRTGQPIELRCRDLRDAVGGVGPEIVIRDWGRQVPLEEICGRDLDDLRPGGLGVHLIRNLMDSAEFSHADGGGMRLVMRVYRQRPARCARPEQGTGT